MRAKRLVLLGLLLTALCLPACSSAGGSSRVIHLFNGSNLEGFYTFVADRGRDNDPKHVYSVVNGMIRISGEEWGSLTTNEEYANYRIICEYKWGDETFPPRVENARDSGLLVHSVGEDGAYSGTWMYSIEVQIIEAGAGDLIVVGNESDKYALTAMAKPPLPNGSRDWDPHEGQPARINVNRINRRGRSPDWKDVIGLKDPAFEKPPGQWNRIDCLVSGNEIHVKLNGKLVNQATQVTPSKGKIQIQSEGAEIFIRRLDLIPLEAQP